MIFFRLFLITQILFNSLVIQNLPRRAPVTASANDIINAVNAYRTQYGLPAYIVDAHLMDIAQTQSAYQASIKTLTHTRVDGSGPQMVSSENIAEGTAARSANSIVQEWTGDAPHTITLIGFRSGTVGAGTATGADGITYYTLDVINTGKTLTGLTANNLPVQSTLSGTTNSPSTPAATLPPIHALLTVTPQADGSVIHTVQYGQNLSTIATAYNLSLKDLMALNHINDPNSIIQIGQHLQIRGAESATPTSPPTSVPPTEVRTATPPVFTPTISPTPSSPPTSTPDSGLSSKSSPVQWIGLVLAGVCILGIGLATMGRFLKRKPPE